MSGVNIKRAVENIRANTNAYTPVVELIVNGIQAIDALGREDGRVLVRVRRHTQQELNGAHSDVVGFEVQDNGVGFTKEHRDSFDTLYTDQKMAEGGKGFGRLIGLKYFRDVHVKSTFSDEDGAWFRQFSMGKDHDIIVDEQITSSEALDSGSTVTLEGFKGRRPYEKKIATIARILVERLLPYFITKDYKCPDIFICEQDDSDLICLNNFVRNELSSAIVEVHSGRKGFALNGNDIDEEFLVRVFKFFSPGKSRSRVSLVAHQREVTASSLQKYIPEFEDEFVEIASIDDSSGRNYVVHAYVFGSYLDVNVSVERSGFEFNREPDLQFGIGQVEIERSAAEVAREVMGSQVVSRQERKRERVQAYVDDQAPWYKPLLKTLDLSAMPLNPTEEDIVSRCHRAKFEQDVAIRRDVARLMNETSSDRVAETVTGIVSSVSESSKIELVHYIGLRRTIIDLFRKSLSIDESGSYASEGMVHDIIFPRKNDSDSISFEDHNLWIIDERLNFTSWVSSDLAGDGKSGDRPDVLIYDRRVLFRGDNEASNPVTIFEFKRPQRDDFVNPSSSEDPVQQIVRYVNDIRDHKYKTPEGRKILVADNTPFYGYVVCDLTPKVERWLEREKNFTPMPDRLGWFHWLGNINLYVEVVSWDKLLKDAVMRNRIFFEKLGII